MNCSNFNCTIKLEDNPLNLKIEDYLSVVLRNNKKRKFLFVSKELGKHLPVDPKKVDELGMMLSNAYKKKYKDYMDEKQMVIGFAETATCLSHSFFNYLESAKFFIHTTREEIKGMKKLEFEEEHSHATEQNIYIDNLENIKNINEVILVDDEITTGKTCINIITKLQEKYDIKKYVIVSILNWIDEKRENEIKEISRKLGCQIDFAYMFRGSFDFEMKSKEPEDIIEKVNKDNNVLIKNIYVDFEKYEKNKKYLTHTGRFGINRNEHKKLLSDIDRESKKLVKDKDSKKILCLGIEEFMYIPMMLSKAISGDVYYHSTTRSPILPIKNGCYPINEKYTFESFYNDNNNFIYNLSKNKYDECFIFMEVKKDNDKILRFIDILKNAGISKVNLVKFFKE